MRRRQDLGACRAGRRVVNCSRGDNRVVTQTFRHILWAQIYVAPASDGARGPSIHGCPGTATFPAPYFHNVLGPLIDQIVGTFFLALFVFAVTDEYNAPVRSNLAPWIIGMIVMAVGMSFGANAGYAINPARDFGPRIFAWIAGWEGWRSPATT